MTTIIYCLAIFAIVSILCVGLFVLLSVRSNSMYNKDEEPMFFVKYDENAFVLEKAHGVEDACYDIYVSEDTEVTTRNIMIPTGIHLCIPEGYVGVVCPRSGNTMKGLCGNVKHKEETIYNTRIPAYVKHGYIDPGYTGEVKVMVNFPNYFRGDHYTIPRGSKIAQIMFLKTYGENIYPVEHIYKTHRGDNGFGSTDSK